MLRFFTAFGQNFLRRLRQLFQPEQPSRSTAEVQLTLVTQFYPPDFAATGQFMDELAQNLSKQGIEVQVFTGQPSYAFDTQTAPDTEWMDKVLVRRSRFLRGGSRKWAGRTVSSLAFCAHAIWHLLKPEHRGNVLLLTSEPPFLQVIGWMLKLLFNIPFVTLVYDLYPEVAVELRVLSQNHWLIRFWDAVNRRVWNAADAIVVPCHTMRDRIVAKVPEVADKITIIHNWADPTWIKPIAKCTNAFAQEHQLVDTFTVLYSGNMGRCHDMDTILGAAIELKNEPVEFLFIGGGPKQAAVMEQIKALKLTNCRFLPYQDKSLLPQSLTACDLSLVSVDTGMEGLVAPSKFYSALSAGRPVAIICEKHSYLRSLVADANCGAAINNGDSKGLAGFIRYLAKDPEMTQRMGQSGYRYIQEYFTPFAISQQYYRILRRAVVKNADLSDALNQSEFRVYYQPVLDLRSGKIWGLEAVVRWQHPTRGLICPAEFVPAAEETGLIISLGWWLLEEACRQLQLWRSQSNYDLKLCINLSSRQFFHPDLIPQIDRALATYQLPTSCLMLEVDDQVAMEDAAATTSILLQLQIRQIPVCIDNFGESYTSLDYLHRFPVAALKIAPSLIGRIGPDKGLSNLLETIVILAKDLNMLAIAKGIETEEQLQRVKEIGLQYGQGFLFSPPVDAESASVVVDSLQSGLSTVPDASTTEMMLSPSSQNASLVLVVDDDRSMRSILKGIIAKEGYRVIEAKNAEEAISLFQTHQPNLILLDALMPDMDGFQCCQQLRYLQNSSNDGAIAVQPVPILMITALDDSTSVDRAFDSGATDYITKPINWAVLRQRLNRLLS
ncbi:EAL domain-containing protein [Leptolyngbya boryana CZ1]|uniref:EAL domain-containing protein n=1 Tax=Leptolyngbya boryana CZ1 TaxID=3060204 RepID=A0AA97ALH9_LEPBY|nr:MULTISPECIES: EAL domain-containing protein [Leptolyngbya]MBD1855441.1 EAL domain-containing protein [Leptolyngbya sp. FACHB-1624]WNZ43372.1 EAL domain-containing protein [Leptolyngbya boryana CZ1]